MPHNYKYKVERDNNSVSVTDEVRCIRRYIIEVLGNLVSHNELHDLINAYDLFISNYNKNDSIKLTITSSGQVMFFKI